MSWWDDCDEVLGDGPADTLKAAWRRVLASRRDAGTSNPNLREMLAAYAASLRGARTDPPFERLVLKRAGDADIVATGTEAAPADLRSEFDRALVAIDKDYRDTLERPPTPMELAKTQEFIVGASPPTYLADSTGEREWRDWQLLAEPSAAKRGGAR
jgi:hypothetical protein